MSFPKILLLTPTPPGEGSVGETYVQELVRAIPADKLCCYAAWAANYGHWAASPDLHNLPIEFAELEKEFVSNSALGTLIAHLHTCFKRRNYWRTWKPVIDEVVEFATAHNSEIVLSFLSTPATVRMTRKITRRLNKPVIVHVSALPQSFMRRHGYDLISRTSIMRYFEDLIRNAETCVVASEAMRTHLFEKYNVQAVLLPHPITDSTNQDISGNFDRTELNRRIFAQKLYQIIGAQPMPSERDFRIAPPTVAR